ncbi:MAG: hypothetical protein V4541_13700 [Bacteroidota bacterium]
MKKSFVYLSAFFIISCTPKEPEKTNINPYFDLSGYFEKETDSLNKREVLIDKTVSINGKAERKKVKIKDFKNELSSFIAADINKASWRGAFKVNKGLNLTIYTNNSEKIPVKELSVAFQNSKIFYVKILIVNSNILYTSRDTLIYYPDSLYEIKKTQKIKLLAEKNYAVLGRFK